MEDIDNLISPLFSEDESAKKQKKISNILVKLSTKDLKIKNVSKSPKYAVWVLRKDDTQKLPDFSRPNISRVTHFVFR